MIMSKLFKINSHSDASSVDSGEQLEVLKMDLNEVLSVIEESCRENDELFNNDISNDDWIDNRKEREFNIKRINEFIEFELSEAEKVIYDAGEAEFYLDEKNPGMTGFYKKLDEAYKHSTTVWKIAVIKKCLQARNYGINGRLPDGSDSHELVI
jgi:hypothetical protein